MYFTTQVSVHFNISQLPSIWKISRTTPVYKNKGSEQEVSNYRPISITSVICKILENIIFKYIRTTTLFLKTKFTNTGLDSSLLTQLQNSYVSS